MNKLGIIINRISQGAELIHVFQAEEWESEILDPRSYLNALNLDAIKESEYYNTFFDFLAFGKNVSFYCLGHFISGRGGDLVSAMIAIPDEIKVSGVNLEQLIKEVKNLMRKVDMGDYHNLDSLIRNVDCEKRGQKLMSSPSPLNGKFAFLYYGKDTDYSLSEILESMLYHPDYKGYNAIFLIESGSYYTPKDELKDNILNQKKIRPKEQVILKYPEEELRGIELLINGQSFKEDYLGYKDDHITLTFQRVGWTPSREKQTIDLVNGENIVPINDIVWKKKVLRELFKVTDKESNKDSNKLDGAKVFINGKEVDGKNFFEEGELSDAELSVTCGEKYQDYAQKMNILDKIEGGGEDAVILIEMKKKPLALTYVIEKDPSNDLQNDVTITYSQTTRNPMDSPLKYYSVARKSEDPKKKNTYYLRANRFSKKERMAGITILALALWGTITLSQLAVVKIQEVNKQMSDKRHKDDSTDCIKYLEKSVWKKEDMEKYDELRGLFDIIRDKNVQAIEQKYYSIFERSTQLKNLVYSLKNNEDINMSKYIKDGKLKVDEIISSPVYADCESVEEETSPSLEALDETEIAYLRNNSERWILSEMEDISPRLGLLFRDVNNRDKNKINNEWKGKLQNVKEEYLDRIIHAINNPKCIKTQDGNEKIVSGPYLEDLSKDDVLTISEFLIKTTESPKKNLSQNTNISYSTSKNKAVEKGASNSEVETGIGGLSGE